MDLGIKIERKKRVVYGLSKIKWGALTKNKSQELVEKLRAVGAWSSSGDTSSMWTRSANCIKKTAREVLGVSKCYSGRHKRD